MNLVKVNKSRARKENKKGNNVYILPNSIRLDSPWMKPYLVTTTGEDFEKTLSNYEYYNCNTQTGKHLAYYIEE